MYSQLVYCLFFQNHCFSLFCNFAIPMAETDNNSTDSKPKISKERLKSALYIFKYIKPYKWKFIIGMILLALTSILFLIFVPISGEVLNVALGESKYNFTMTDVGLFLIIIPVSYTHLYKPEVTYKALR